jgi:hypothetical protein
MMKPYTMNDAMNTACVYCEGPTTHGDLDVARLYGRDPRCADCAAIAERCSICRGEIFGEEVDYGTCGHCGGRSIYPEVK